MDFLFLPKCFFGIGWICHPILKVKCIVLKMYSHPCSVMRQWQCVSPYSKNKIRQFSLCILIISKWWKVKFLNDINLHPYYGKEIKYNSNKMSKCFKISHGQWIYIHKNVNNIHDHPVIIATVLKWLKLLFE